MAITLPYQHLPYCAIGSDAHLPGPSALQRDLSGPCSIYSYTHGPPGLRLCKETSGNLAAFAATRAYTGLRLCKETFVYPRHAQNVCEPLYCVIGSDAHLLGPSASARRRSCGADQEPVPLRGGAAKRCHGGESKSIRPGEARVAAEARWREAHAPRVTAGCSVAWYGSSLRLQAGCRAVVPCVAAMGRPLAGRGGGSGARCISSLRTFSGGSSPEESGSHPTSFRCAQMRTTTTVQG